MQNAWGSSWGGGRGQVTFAWPGKCFTALVCWRPDRARLLARHWFFGTMLTKEMCAMGFSPITHTTVRQGSRGTLKGTGTMTEHTGSQ